MEAIVKQLVDAFAGTRIATAVAAEQLARVGVTPGLDTMQRIAGDYAGWAEELGSVWQAGQNPLVRVSAVEGEEQEGGGMTAIIGLITAAMMVFYVFFSGGASAQSILQEDEAGTLPHLFTTPTPT